MLNVLDILKNMQLRSNKHNILIEKDDSIFKKLKQKKQLRIKKKIAKNLKFTVT